MREEYNWEYKLEKDFNFDGGFAAKMKVLREEIMEDWPDLGTGKNVQDAGVDSTQDVDITVFDENNPEELLLKVMASNAMYFALRGSQEHAYLKMLQIQFGIFEKGHPLEGMMYVKATQLNDKGTKITFTNGRKRDTKREMRLPVDPYDLSCPGGTIYRYVQKCAPYQKHVHCYPAKPGKLTKLQKQGAPHVAFSPNRQIGKNKIDTRMKDA